MTVSSERGTSENLPPVSDCKYGDTVKLLFKKKSHFTVFEIAIIGKQGDDEVTSGDRDKYITIVVLTFSVLSCCIISIKCVVIR